MHILLAEDDDFLRNAYADKLRSVGCEVDAAENGKRALELLRTKRPVDLILCDVLMPEMDGFGFIQAARDEDLIGRTRIVMLTNLDDEQHMAQALALGVRAYFLKSSMSMEDLVQLVKGPSPTV